MNIDFLKEPELEFGVDRHIDIRFGLMNYGPVDYAHPLAPKQIRLGVVGTNETVEGVQRWLDRCREEIPAKESKQPNLFPKFPGFRPDAAFQSSLVMDSRLQRTISPREFNRLKTVREINYVVTEAANLFYAELEYLAENTNADVLMCAIPQVLLDITQTLEEHFEETQEEDSEEETGVSLDFHHLLKAKAMGLQIPIQLIIPSTYDEKKGRRKKRRRQRGSTQDEATRAWNLHTALYYKAKGIPWRLVREASEFTTCYIGISFYKTLDGSRLLASVAQVFNERGEGVVVRGGRAKISKKDRQPHLEKDDARDLLDNALALYREEHKNFPARIVVHKSSACNQSEIDGFLEATNNHDVEFVDLVSLTQSYTRLFRLGSYPPLRGTFFSPDAQSHILYTRGSVDFFSTYPGLYVPLPLLFRCDYTE